MTSAIDGFSDAMRKRREEERAAIRREAWEQAAKVCDGLRDQSGIDNGYGHGAHDCADAIRALIDQPTDYENRLAREWYVARAGKFEP